ncbi:hypothetical protein AVEN_2402-1 [Araneus ventricosus]|uniref:Uncharacterized protein n=1 Tax=Araneus ventricosus TaxID=182803 RepID=A0A4Y2TPU8_ARAVE|nr:hypothetical protein AVEN_2402-1 [Araneus ventricosus]
MASAHNVPQFIALSPGPVIIGSPSPPAEDCGKIPADDCLDDLQTFMRLTALPFTDDANELDGLCNSGIAWLQHCSSTYTRALLAGPSAGNDAHFISLHPVVLRSAKNGHTTPRIYERR